MFDNLCSFPLSSDLFAQAIHPNAPLLAVGLSSGHVETFKLPLVDDAPGPSPLTGGRGQIESSWRTKRHKISCRSLTYSLDGLSLYSAGADGIVKEAESATGKVKSKISIPVDKSGNSDSPALLHNLSPQTLLVATDSSALYIYDLRSFSNSKPQSAFYPHEDYIASLTPLPPSAESTSGFSKQWVSVGGTTLALTDMRKGVLKQSADQDSELLSTVFVEGFSTKGTNVGAKVIVGDGNGNLSLWERGVWDDMDERIVIDRGLQEGTGESVECMINVPYDIAGNSKMVACGMGAGMIACVQLGQNKVVDVFRHDEVESVVALGFDSNNRMISGGGQIVKVWQEKLDEDEEDNDDDNDDDSDDEATDAMDLNGNEKRSLDSDSDDSDNSSSEEEEQQKRPKRKKKKRNGTSAPSPSLPAMGSYKGLD